MARSGGQQKKASEKNGAKAAKKSVRALRANERRDELVEDIQPMFDVSPARDIVGVVLAVVAVASFIAVITPATAPVTRAISSFYHLGFGLGAYVLPLALLAVSALLFLKEEAPLTARTLVGGSVIFLAVCTVLSLLVPGTEASASGMFQPGALSSSGGYVGAFFASFLQNALGKTIALVVAFGVGMLGLVILGFSISQFVRGASERAGEIARKRRLSVNDSPWGGESSSAGTVRGQGSLFDDAPPETTFLGNRETTVLPVRDEPDDPDENPFVDVSDDVDSERAKTRFIPLKERFAKRSASDAAADPDGDAAADGEAARALDVIERSKVEVAATAAAPIPAFLRSRVDTSSDSAVAAELDEIAPWVDPASAGEGSAASEAPAADGDERKLPPASMLARSPRSSASSYSEDELEQTASALQSTLQEFGLHSRVVGWISGPTVTTFKVQPGEGERVSRISNLEDDIALSLATDSVRIFAPIPGTSLVGIEIPNRSRQNVSFGDILPYVKGGPLEFALGRDAEGTPMVADLAKMPHLLIAGTTGSGKSVVISSILMSLLMRTFPEDVRLIMIDPKRVEFAPYDGLPHLYVPVVTEPKQAASALQWAVSEMERRLKIFERIGVRKISTFNDKQAAGEFDHYDNPPVKMPYLVIVIDELSDLMMVAGKDVEASIVRIAQLGRAAGIHMIVATQRPSSNVVTGLIKANITNRIGLTVATGIDSRVILDQTGAEKLLGQGDMLFSRVDWGKPKRIQGCYVSDEEIVDVVGFVKEQSTADYHEEILSAVAPAMVSGGGAGSSSGDSGDDDPLLWDAARIVVESQLGSTSGLQRRLKVGYARAGRIMDMLEEKGVVGPPDGSKPREVLLDPEGLAELESLEARMAHEDELGGF